MATPVHELDLPEIDLFGVAREEKNARYAAAREEHWLARMPMGYAVMRHADVVALLRERRFHSAIALLGQMAGVADEEFANRQTKSILAMEGDPHGRLRRLVAPAFTPRSADRLRPFMREVVGGLIDPVVASGGCELVADVCEPYPIPIVCELLGAPKEDWKLFSAWATDIFRIFNGDIAGDLETIKAAMQELDAYVRAMIDERRASTSTYEDLLSDLLAAEEAGDRLSTDELVMMTEAVLMAGTDTTRNQLACAVALFTDFPDQWRLLGEHPELAATAVEECMRVLGAVRGTARIASEDIEYRDVLFPAGTLVAISLQSANFDPAVMETPGDFDITRKQPAQQMTFGSGIHHCLGASLARAELQEALPLLARRMPDLAVDGAIEWKPETFGIWGPARLPLRFAPSSA
ncbi:MAG TPA: cytochrome P450 [Acidimicrobiales bacterium]|nr:cytochrome P450 [Acidimicrobiales bacterium]